MVKISKRWRTVVIISGVLLLAASAALLTSHPLRRNVRIGFETVLAHAYAAPKNNFPNISPDNLTASQQKIVQLSKQEYYKKPVSFDQNVLKYSRGYKEPWCANFVSWIMKEAGQPLSNPNSGSWRIPGVNTLQEYFQRENKYVGAGTYTPKVGDTAIYLKDRGHTNIVIAVNGDMMTTVGGNETGHLRTNIQSFTYGSEGLSGFGTLSQQ